MANTTNFGWETPDDTDLVKDGAAAMRTLGNAIDTSFVDLKGGTTGQILSKASNTDLDYTWVSPNPGDITSVAAGTGLSGGGTSGDVTLSFDVANYGGGQFAAGKNKIINGDFGIWQRGTSFTYTGYAPSYTADRFYYQTDATGGSPSYTVSQQTFTPGAAPVTGYEGTYYLRLACTTKGTTVGYSLFKSPIEDVRTLAGQTVTLSFWAKASSSTNFKTTCEQNFGSGGSAQVSEIGATNFTLTTSWVRYSTTFTMTSISGKTIGTGSNLTVVLNSTAPVNGLNIDIWGVQLEAGSVATPFQTATGTKQGELAACERYYKRWTTDGNNYNPLTQGFPAQSSTAVGIPVQYPTTMRVAPTSIEYGNLSVYGGGSSGLGFVAVTSASLTRASTNLAEVLFSVSSGLTTGNTYRVQPNNAAGYFAVVAEL